MIMTAHNIFIFLDRAVFIVCDHAHICGFCRRATFQFINRAGVTSCVFCDGAALHSTPVRNIEDRAVVLASTQDYGQTAA